MNRRPKNILLLGAGFGTNNRGVAALAVGALTIVSRACPGASVSLLDYSSQATVSRLQVDGRAVEVPLINLRFSWKPWLANNVVLVMLLALLARVTAGRMRSAVVRSNRWLAAIDDADLALAVSGGDSFSDIYGFRRFCYVTLPQLLIAILGIRLVLLPQTIGPFKGAVAKAIAQRVLRYASEVYSRDEDGVRVVQNIIGSDPAREHARFCPDMAFVMEPLAPGLSEDDETELASIDDSRPLVGLNVSGLLHIGGYTKRNMFNLTVSYADLVDRVIAFLIDVKGANVLLVPHVFGEQGESDSSAIASIYEEDGHARSGRLFRVRGNYDQNEIKHVIGRCDFFLGSRMHACIAALSQGVPAVGLAYSQKFAGVYASVGVDNLVVDLRGREISELLDLVANAYDYRQSTSKHLREAMPAVKTRILGLLDRVL